MCRSMVDIQSTAAQIRRGLKKTRMWANAQRDGRPAEHRWRRLFNVTVWLTPTTRCRAVTLKPHNNLNPITMAKMKRRI